MCADLLYSGITRKEIVQELTKKYHVSAGGVDKWIKAARPLLAARQEQAEEIRARIQAEQIEEVARELGINRKVLLTELKKIALMDVRKLYKPDGTLKKISELDDETAGAIAGIEVFEENNPVTGKLMGTNRKVKRDSKLAAIDLMCKLLAYFPPTKIAATDSKGKDVKKSYKVTLNL